MDPVTGQIAQAVVGAGMQGIQMGTQNQRNKKAYEQQVKLMGIQHKNQQDLNLQGYGLQKQMWDYTNYGNQMKHMKEAGLNPSLMYGMKGGGGVTTGSQGGGSAASGQAPAQPNTDMNAAMMGMQMRLMESQASNLDAKTKNEAGGVADNLQADFDNKMETLKGQEVTNEIQRKSKDAQILKLQRESVTEGMKTMMMKAKIKLDGKKYDQLHNKIFQDWAKVGFQGLDSILGIVFKNASKIAELGNIKVPTYTSTSTGG